MPQSSRVLVNSGGVEVLCQKMQNIEYIDVAEAAIRALEKISFDYGLSILEAGGMEIMLTLIDFFVASTQVGGFFLGSKSLEIHYEYSRQYI